MADQKPTRRRLSLMEAYGSFSDEHLQNVARKIKEMGVRIDDSVDDSIDQRIDQISDSVDDQIGDSVDDQPALLTINQALLYYCLKILNGNATSLNLIAQEIKVSVYTLKSCLLKLRKDKLIAYGGMCNCGGRVGFTAKTVNRPILLRGNKSELYSRLNSVNSKKMMFLYPITDATKKTHSDIPQNHSLDHLVDHLVESTYSSSSFLEVPTTTKEIHNLTKSIAETLANHPELAV